MEEEKAYLATFHVTRIPRCCATCKYFDRYYEESGCCHPKQAEFDSYEQRRRAAGMEHGEYGALGIGISVDEGYVCDLWEQDNGEQAERNNGR